LSISVPGFRFSRYLWRPISSWELSTRRQAIRAAPRRTRRPPGERPSTGAKSSLHRRRPRQVPP
jgi:hypothetical protein